MHTRIRASNILITTFGVCKVAEPSPQVNISDTGVNVDGVVGNAYWSAPEILLQVSLVFGRSVGHSFYCLIILSLFNFNRTRSGAHFYMTSVCMNYFLCIIKQLNNETPRW